MFHFPLLLVPMAGAGFTVCIDDYILSSVFQVEVGICHEARKQLRQTAISRQS